MFRITLTKTYSFLLLCRTHTHWRPNTGGDPVSTPLQIRRRGNTLEAVTDSVYLANQKWVNEGMSRRAIHKAFWESATLIGPSVLQVYLL
ncbi:unnamed protein product [Camellia sinensis]